MKTVIVIPARLQSTRLERKLLLSETGKPLIQHTCEAAAASSLADTVVVATDHSDIVEAVEAFGGNVVMTSAEHLSGTSRVSEIARNSLGEDVDLIVNVQGDEPEISGAAIDSAIRILTENPDVMISTLATPIRDRRTLEDPACVKVVFDHKQRAMYFSRAPIPFERSQDDSLLTAEPTVFHLHIGLYAYRREFLLEFPQLPDSRIESIEALEQLRFLDAGYPIAVGVVDHAAPGIDTAVEYEAFVHRMRS
ncbi:MAG: 3-deoxy-manno-octulosonate cytidylyltransferase [Planctomycetota bacterium]